MSNIKLKQLGTTTSIADVPTAGQPVDITEDIIVATSVFVFNQTTAGVFTGFPPLNTTETLTFDILNIGPETLTVSGKTVAQYGIARLLWYNGSWY